MATEIDIAVTTTTYNVSITADPNEYIVNITTNGGSGGIESVTGTTVDNTDPLNPVVEVPNLTQVLETGNTTVDIGILLTNPPGDFASLNHNQLNVTDGDYTGSLKKNVLQFFNIATGLTTNFLPTGLSFIKSGSESTEVSFETPTALNNILIPNQSGTVAMLSDIPAPITIDATPTDGSSNAVSSNGVFDALASKENITAATTGAVISFATPQIYNSIASPSASNITDNLTGARIGVVQKIYHNAGTTPTFPAGWVRRGTGTYVTSTLNIIYAEWSVGTTVEYWITQ